MPRGGTSYEKEGRPEENALFHLQDVQVEMEHRNKPGYIGGGTSAPDVTKSENAGERNMNIHNYPVIRMPNPQKLRKRLRLTSEPLFLLVFAKEGEEYLVELTQKQIAKLLEKDGIHLISLQASIDKEGNWRKKEVWI